jgi:hypothetical protein
MEEGAAMEKQPGSGDRFCLGISANQAIFRHHGGRIPDGRCPSLTFFAFGFWKYPLSRTSREKKMVKAARPAFSL